MKPNFTSLPVVGFEWVKLTFLSQCARVVTVTVHRSIGSFVGHLNGIKLASSNQQCRYPSHHR